MSLISVTSPHFHKLNKSAKVMRLVILACVPGLLAMTYFFGWNTLINLIWASVLALGFEAWVMKLRHRPVLYSLQDGSAILTVLLLVLAIPPFAPWWLTLVGVLVAIVIAKHLYGGLGQNPFNPAMVAYALLLVAFPVEMSRWSLPHIAVVDTTGFWQVPSFYESILIFLESVPADIIDSYTSATALDVLRNRNGLTLDEIWQQNSILQQGVVAWYWISVAYLIGGLFLLYKKVFTWHAPVTMLLTLLLWSLLFVGFEPDYFVGPMTHLFTGGTMLAAFFIITDPVTSATSNKGRIYFGIFIGSLIFIIRTWGGYPDAIAFSVLLLNLAVPFIDQYTQPRTYGHTKPKYGPKESQ